jgi:hypothetical protein
MVAKNLASIRNGIASSGDLKRLSEKRLIKTKRRLVILETPYMHWDGSARIRESIWIREEEEEEPKERIKDVGQSEENQEIYPRIRAGYSG